MGWRRSGPPRLHAHRILKSIDCAQAPDLDPNDLVRKTALEALLLLARSPQGEDILTDRCVGTPLGARALLYLWSLGLGLFALSLCSLDSIWP